MPDKHQYDAMAYLLHNAAISQQEALERTMLFGAFIEIKVLDVTPGQGAHLDIQANIPATVNVVRFLPDDQVVLLIDLGFGEGEVTARKGDTIRIQPNKHSA